MWARSRKTTAAGWCSGASGAGLAIQHVPGEHHLPLRHLVYESGWALIISEISHHKYHFYSNRSLFIFYSYLLSTSLRLFLTCSFSSALFKLATIYFSLLRLSLNCFSTFASLDYNCIACSRSIDFYWLKPTFAS